MNNNLISFNPCQDVFLYFDDSSLKNCVDIDIKEGVDTVVFDGGNSQISINLRNVNKQFPDVKTIVINEDVIEVNYPPLARAEVGASGQRSLVTTPAKPGSYQRPSFFLPTKNVELRSKSGNEPCCKAGELSMLHRQAPVFHRLVRYIGNQAAACFSSIKVLK